MRATCLLALAALLAACSPPAPRAPDAAPDVPDHDRADQAPAAATLPAADTRPGSTSTPEPAPDPCDWTRIALPAHRAMVDTTPQALLDAMAGAEGDAAQLRPLLARPALPLGDITGDWRARSLQSNLGSVFAYPDFAAEIAPDACGYAFAKTSGSQRRSGLLYPVAGDDRRLAFLGASTVNEDPPRAYEPERPPSTQRTGEENSAGVLYRIGPSELLMLLDAQDDGRFEVYHLRR